MEYVDFADYKKYFLTLFPNAIEELKNLQTGESKWYKVEYCAEWTFNLLTPEAAQEEINKKPGLQKWKSKCLRCEEPQVVNTYARTGQSYHENWVCPKCHLEVKFYSIC